MDAKRDRAWRTTTSRRTSRPSGPSGRCGCSCGPTGSGRSRTLDYPAATPYSVSFYTLPRHWELSRDPARSSGLGENALPTAISTRPRRPTAAGSPVTGLPGWTGQRSRSTTSSWTPGSSRRTRPARSVEPPTARRQAVPARRACCKRIEDPLPPKPPSGPACSSAVRHARSRSSSKRANRPRRNRRPCERVFLAVNSPPVKFPPGSWVRISGWIKSPEQPGRPDGTVRASGPRPTGRCSSTRRPGEAYAVRVTERCCEWKQFHLYRKVPANGEVRVRMALTGFGTVYFDDIRIEPYIGTRQAMLPIAEAGRCRVPRDTTGRAALHQQDDSPRASPRPSSATAGCSAGRTTSIRMAARGRAHRRGRSACPRGTSPPRTACLPSRSPAGRSRSSSWPAGGSGFWSCRGPVRRHPRPVRHRRALSAEVGAARSTSLEWPEEPLPRRTVAQLDHIFKHGEGPFLLGACQTLVDGGRIALVRDQPEPDLCRDMWNLLPGQHPPATWPATFAYSTVLGFGLVVLPAVPEGGLAGYLTEDQARDYPESQLRARIANGRRAQRPADGGHILARRTSVETLRLAVWMVLAATVLAVGSRLLMAIGDDDGRGQSGRAGVGRAGRPAGGRGRVPRVPARRDEDSAGCSWTRRTCRTGRGARSETDPSFKQLIPYVVLRCARRIVPLHPRVHRDRDAAAGPAVGRPGRAHHAGGRPRRPPTRTGPGCSASWPRRWRSRGRGPKRPLGLHLRRPDAGRAGPHRDRALIELEEPLVWPREAAIDEAGFAPVRDLLAEAGRVRDVVAVRAGGVGGELNRGDEPPVCPKSRTALRSVPTTLTWSRGRRTCPLPSRS